MERFLHRNFLHGSRMVTMIQKQIELVRKLVYGIKISFPRPPQ